MEQATTEFDQRNNILLGENGDILARYRIPQGNNQVDPALQLPEDSDSSNFSSDAEEGENDDNPSENTGMPDNNNSEHKQE